MKKLSTALALIFLIGSVNDGYTVQCPGELGGYQYVIENDGTIRKPIDGRRWRVEKENVRDFNIVGSILTSQFRGGTPETGCKYFIRTNNVAASVAATVRLVP